MKNRISKTLVISSIGIIIVLISFSFMNKSNYFAKTPPSEILKNIIEKFESFSQKTQDDKVYLHFDKTLYKPGETIWFSAYVRKGKDLKKSEKSDIVNVELISPKGTIVNTLKIIVKDGVAKGDFALSEEVAGGIYKIKASTNWQKNFENDFIFEKEIQVQKFVLPRLKMKLDFMRDAYGANDKVVAELNLNTNENKALSNYEANFVAKLEGNELTKGKFETDDKGTAFIKFELPNNLKSNDGLLNVMISYEGQTESISRSIPIVLNNISLSFFPEGGDMISSLNTNIAFRALDEFGKPADIVGIIVDNSDNKIADFKSFHDGMGGFNFTPKKGEKYHAKITKPEGITEKYELPKIGKSGFVMNIDNFNKDKLLIEINSTIDDEISIVAQVRGEIYYSDSHKTKIGENEISFSTKKFPVGVTQVTLFDSKGIARAERLVFVNKDKQLNIKIKTNKEKYLPREKVKMTISLQDENGNSVAGNLSVAVVDDQLLSFADDKSGNILSKLLLESDVDIQVDEPAFYFDKEEADADQALDYLLMTAGWRRYTWKQVMDNNEPVISFLPEQTVVGGHVYDAYTYEIIKNAKIEIGDSKEYYYTDKEGKFEIRGIDFADYNYLKISAKKYNEQVQYLYTYNSNYSFYIYNNYQIRKQENKNWKKARNAVAVEDDLNFMIEENEMIKEDAVNEVVVVALGILREEVKLPVDAIVDEKKPIIDIPDVDNGIEGPDANFDMEMGEEFIMEDMRLKDELLWEIDKNTYYRAKEFPSPEYNKNDKVDVRTDFRSTIYWNGNVEFDKNGKAEIVFYNSDAISSFKVVTEGISDNGSVGRSEQVFFTQLPFAMSTKLPVEVVTEDIVSIPLTLKNTTKKDIEGKLNLEAPAGFELMSQLNYNQIIKAEETRTLYLKYKVNSGNGESDFKISFKASGLNDAFTQKIKVVSKGFPVLASFSGQAKEASYKVNLQNVVDGSITAQVIAYPSVVSDLMQGVASILREPCGCFEQTSMTSYPNLMVMDYLKTTDCEDEKLMANAEDLLDRGYAKLTSYETPEKGYEWFGGAPGHESLSAYGLMQFNDMLGVYDGVDKEMIDRTANWLMSRKDGKGGFLRNGRALDSYGGADQEITNAYIVWALSEAGYTDIEKEVETSYDIAVKSKDPYLMGLMANTMFNLKDNKKAESLMTSLYKMQDKNGSWTGVKHSITRSSGVSLSIETTSIVTMAMIKSKSPKNNSIQKSIKYLMESRNGYGTFGNTQGTILALKALTAFAKFSKKTDESGTIEIYVDKVKVAEYSYEKGENKAIEITGLEEYITEGKHKIDVKYVGAKNPLPYSIAVQWNTTLPNSSPECVIDFDCKLATNKAKVGENVRLSVNLTNKTAEGQPMTVAIIGIPAGLTAQPWQLKELQEKQVVDYYETSGNNIILYYRDLAPSEVHTINLDLKAELPGIYDAPASSAYLYYTNEFKVWKALDIIEIKK